MANIYAHEASLSCNHQLMFLQYGDSMARGVFKQQHGSTCYHGNVHGLIAGDFIINFKTNIQMPNDKKHGKSLDSLRFNSNIGIQHSDSCNFIQLIKMQSNKQTQISRAMHQGHHPYVNNQHSGKSS